MTVNSIDLLWVLVCALFVFFMQAGFICYEVGFIRSKNVVSVAIENIVAFVITTLCYMAVGYGLMFGPTFHGLFGTDYWLASHLENNSSYVYLFFELMFAGTAVTIFSGSMSERTKTKKLIVSAIIVGALIYPIYGHWVWGGLYHNQATFLSQLGFIDFAGATVVHGTAGWIALAGILIVGPRKGRWDANGKQNALGRSNIPFAALGTFILWFSWFGFNGGSLLKFSDQVGLILLNTNLAATAGVLGAVITVFFFLKKHSYMEAIFAGALGGLVAITASSNLLEPIQAFWIGLITGSIVVLGGALLDYLKIDDAVGAVPIHAFGGVAGSLLLAFFAPLDQLHYASRWMQFGIQGFGVLINFVWAFGMGYIMFWVLNHFGGLRVSEDEEEKGLNIVEFADVYTWQQTIKDQKYQNLTNELYDQIKKQNLELETRANMLVATQEQERETVARDLHDGVGQLLAATKIDLGLLRKKSENETEKVQINRIIQTIDQTVEEIRNVIYNLKPIHLEDHGLLASITLMTERMNKLSGIQFNYHMTSDLPNWGETNNLNLFRVIQECLNNILKHAQASRVDLIFSELGTNTYLIIIQDDGIGFVYEDVSKGMGMTTLKDRTSILGGKLTIESVVGQGTKLILEVPYATN